VSWSHRIAVVYEKSEGDSLVITIICSSVLKDMIDRRWRSGRWI
jgi:pyruvate formate-lyase activating enzyme-like uncharacterized protein